MVADVEELKEKLLSEAINITRKRNLKYSEESEEFEVFNPGGRGIHGADGKRNGVLVRCRVPNGGYVLCQIVEACIQNQRFYISRSQSQSDYFHSRPPPQTTLISISTPQKTFSEGSKVDEASRRKHMFLPTNPEGFGHDWSDPNTGSDWWEDEEVTNPVATDITSDCRILSHQSIPPELKSYIATFCTPATLANLALVHKSFQEESEAILYKQLDVYIKKTESTSIWSTLKLHPDKALLVRSLAIWFRPPWDSHNDDVPIAYTELFCCALANMHGLVDLRLHLSHRDVEWQVRITAVLSKKHFNLHSLHCSQFFDLCAITDAQSDTLQILGGVWVLMETYLRLF
ncbi:uncharacterized protein C8R40DRAFT_1073965 [Lentinula edodes]|uniref:uncharacterized protein n=1 Tax=Lentinula edodes TaxID=5353 RepID=UPI001E8E83EB|nr:uncharacterized protein C8R40DRAFT_1073965 [Lentinula edodes]KAH7869657.1 hypothetical protein C8R40DRAFT_1073965 [Lentinula edodes]